MSCVPPAPVTINTASPQYAGLVALWNTIGADLDPLEDLVGSNDLTPVPAPPDGDAPVLVSTDWGDVVEFESAKENYFVRASTPVGSLPFTLTIWFNMDSASPSANESLFYMGMNTGGGTIYVAICYLDTTGHLNYFSQAGGDFENLISPGTITASTWHHGCVVVGADGNDRRLYLDGAPVDSGTTPTFTPTPGFQTMSLISNLYAGSARSGFASGRVAEARVYNRAMTDEEVAELYDCDTRWELYEAQFNAACLAVGSIPSGGR